MWSAYVGSSRRAAPRPPAPRARRPPAAASRTRARWRGRANPSPAPAPRASTSASRMRDSSPSVSFSDGSVTAVFTGALGDERPAVATEAELGARAVGVAVLLAQIEVQAADELPAEERVGHQAREVVLRLARRARHPEAHLGLRGAWAIDDHHAARDVRGAVAATCLGLPLPVAVQPAKAASSRRVMSSGVTSPTTMTVAGIGPQPLVVPLDDRCAIERLQRRFVADLGQAVARLLAVDDARQRVARHRRRHVAQLQRATSADRRARGRAPCRRRSAAPPRRR